MDDLNSSSSHSESSDKPIPFDDKSNSSGSSRPPLFLGSNDASKAAPKPVKPVENRSEQPKPVSTERITGVKIFLTKLHAGALEFLNEQISTWLKNNPDVNIKQTNTISGMVVGKKTEPNIIITVWY